MLIIPGLRSITIHSDKRADDEKANVPKVPEKTYKVTVSVKDKWGRSIDIIATSEMEIVDMVKAKIVAAVSKMTFDSHYQRDNQVENVLSELSKTLTENQVEDLRIKIDWKL